MKTVIKNGNLLLEKENGFQVVRGDVEIEDEAIKRIVLDGEQSEKEFDKMIDAENSLVIPGLINAHTHAYMSIFRNYADDKEFFDWLHSVEEVEDQMTAEDCYWTSLLSITEMIKTGTTCFVDMYIRGSVEGAKTGPKGAIASAVNDSGIRAFIGRGLVGEAGEERALERINEFLCDLELNDGSDRLKFILAPHAPYSCTQGLLKEVRDLAMKRNLPVTIHVSESDAEVEMIAEKYGGVTPVEYVEESGLFDAPVIVAHAVKITDDDVKILKNKEVSVAINPRSNMKLGNGFASVQKILDAGVNVCLGTDGSGSNNTQNMFQEMQFASLVYKGDEKKAKCVDAKDVVRMATSGGAKALRMEGEIGVLREGALADVAIIDLNVPEFVPRNDLVSALCYSANGSEVKTVLVNGNVLMENRKIMTFDEKEVYEKCNKIADRLGMNTR